MRIVMAGTSGFLGRHLVSRLSGEGHEVIKLVRRPPRSIDEVEWNPAKGELDPHVLDGAGLVVNLCGAGVADKRWTPQYKRLIRESRVAPTQLLAEAVATVQVPSMVNASAVGWYGDGGGVAVDESAPYSTDFLGTTCKAWEDATGAASQAGARVATLRSGQVLSADSELFTRLLPLFRLGLGGRFGSGRQYFSWITLADWISAAQFVCEHPISGPVNLVGPTPATNAQFAHAFGRALGRPAVFTVPALALKVAVGEAAGELLRGAKVIPKVLNDNSFRFRHTTIDDAMTWTVNSR